MIILSILFVLLSINAFIQWVVIIGIIDDILKLEKR